MKLRDMIEAERYFGPSNTGRPYKIKKEVSIKDILKFHRDMEEYHRFIKEKEKKEERKEHKGPLPHDWSIGKKAVFLSILGPPLGIGYVFGLVIMTRMLANFIVWH